MDRAGRPTEGEPHSSAAEFGLHPLAVEDAEEATPAAETERYGDTLFVVLRAARHLAAPREIDFAELHAFVGPGFVITGPRRSRTPDGGLPG